MNIKVCGITTLKQLQQLDGLNVDFAGFIFHKDSPRYMGEKLAASDVKGSDFDLKKVGVFVNSEMTEVLDAINNYGLDVVQLHGDETPEMCDALSAEVEVIKVFSIANDTKNIDELVKPYDGVCDYYLFDNKPEAGFGGSGQKFDWEKIAASKIEKPFFLSGGIGPHDAKLLKTFKHPDYFGADLNSLFEKEPGIKDMAMVLKLMHGLK